MAEQVFKAPIRVSDIRGNAASLGGLLLSKQKVFVANAQTGTGSSQNVAHGLGATPAGVLAIPTDGGTVTYGTHTGTNVVVTCTNAKKFDVLAWL